MASVGDCNPADQSHNSTENAASLPPLLYGKESNHHKEKLKDSLSALTFRPAGASVEIGFISQHNVNCSFTALYFTLIFDRSTLGLGNFGSIFSSVSTIIWDTARLRNHFLFDGITNHGAVDVLHRLNTASYAAT